jgi:hypothetical protein
MRHWSLHRPHLLACILGLPPATARARTQIQDGIRRHLATLETTLSDGVLSET